MRAICEACTRPQPLDWQPGDHCVWCGEAVRREVRCFWCANWTPAVKFCRTCGAATVESSVYGAARMLKDAGCDRFTVPRQLTELDPDQVENFTRMYQEHAAVAAHHVEQAAFLEQYLEQKHWSAALDQSLAPQLPWPSERFEAMRAAAVRVPAQAAPLQVARAIAEASPFPVSRSLAAMARLALEDWTALDEVATCLTAPEDALRTEAVLAVSHWRVLYGPGLPSRRREILEELRRCPLRPAASVRLALLGEPTGDPLPPGDFATALANDDVDFLSATAAGPGDPMRRYAAAQKLIPRGVLTPVGPVLLAVSEERQIELLGLLERRKKPAPELRDTLFQLARETKHRRVRQFACYTLCYGCPADEVLALSRAAQGDPQVYQAILQRSGLPPSGLEMFGEFLLQTGAFRMSQFGMSDAAKQGRMPADFVQHHWRDANAELRIELCKFAEEQLGHYGDETLHRFLVDVAFSAALQPDDAGVSRQAWTCLNRWYDSFGYPRRRPVKVSAESIATFFGSGKLFALRSTELLRERPLGEAITAMLRYPESSALPGFAAAHRETLALAEALVLAMRDSEVDFTLRLFCTDFLGYLGSESTFAAPVTKLLTSFAGSDLDLQSRRALERMANGPAWD